MLKKNVIVGLGEIGNPILKLLSKNEIVVGYDINKKLTDKKKLLRYEKYATNFLHICIPFGEKFNSQIILLNKKFNPSCIVIHSTIKPGTTKKLQLRLKIPIIYSATRGVHKRMLFDLKRYTKFFAIENNAPRKKWASTSFVNQMKKCKIKTKKMSSPMTLELAKIVCDTSYYGWLISYAQISNLIARQNNVNFDEMWTFSDEIHKFLGNRPKLFPGFIGGHCVIPNLELISNPVLNMIKDLNYKNIKTVN